MKIILFLGLLSLSVHARELISVTTSYDFKSAPEFQAIVAQLKTYGEFASKPSQEVVEVKKTMSRGELMVEEAKARNRARLAEMRKEESKKADSESIKTELQKWKREERETLNQWKKETSDLLAQWKKEQEIFLGRIPVYKESTFTLPVKTEKIIEKKVPVEVIPDFHIVNGTFNIPMRDQYNRPTCVAFAGIRGIEILLAQNNAPKDLSEQYLYWAGKPKCQKSPCREKGSWIREAYGFSKTRPVIDIPLEKNCSYQGHNVADNETQLPLASTCFEGSVKVSGYEEVRSLSEVVEKVKKNQPVVVAAKLTENFYKNKGVITLGESEFTGQKLDRHSLGHAFLAVGVMELPKNLQEKEGHYCLVVANSWGRGWGAGGYSCITQKWFEKYRQPSPFVALTKISMKSSD